jgi:hypothetical protein
MANHPLQLDNGLHFIKDLHGRISANEKMIREYEGIPGKKNSVLNSILLLRLYNIQSYKLSRKCVIWI